MTRVMSIVSALCVIAIMILICADVASRSLTGASIGGAVEYSEVLLVVAVALGLGPAQAAGDNVSMNIVVDHLPIRVAAIARFLAYLVAIALMAWMTVACAQLAWTSFHTNEVRFGLASVILWPGRTVLALGLAVLTVEMARTALRDVKTLRAGTAVGKETAA